METSTPLYTIEFEALERDLQSHGFLYNSIDELINGPTAPYVEAASILIKHLEKARDPHAIGGIARALTNKAFPDATPALLQRYRDLQKLRQELPLRGLSENEQRGREAIGMKRLKLWSPVDAPMWEIGNFLVAATLFIDRTRKQISVWLRVRVHCARNSASRR